MTGIEVRDGRVRGVRTDRGDVEAEVVVDAGGMFAAEIGRMAGVRVPLIPMSHQYLVTQPLDGSRGARRRRRPHAAHPARPRPARLLPRGRRRAGDGRLRAPQRAGLPARRHRRGSSAIPADFNGRLLEEDWDRFEEITENSKRRVPAMDEITVTKLINGPEAFTPDNEFCLGETEVARLLRLRRLLRPRPRRRRRDRQGDGRVDRRGRAEPRPLAHGHPPLRRPVPLARLHPRADQGDLRDLLRHPLSRTTSAAPGGRCGSRRPTPGTASTAPPSARSPAGSGSTGTSRTPPPGDESLRPRGWAGQHWSPAIGAEHRATREAVALFDETSFAKLEIEGPGAAAFLEGLCDNRVAREVGQITYTQMLNRRGGIECDFTVARLGEERFSIVTGTAFGNHDREWMRRHLPGDGEVQRPRRHLAVGLLRDLGAAGARGARSR